MGFTKDLVHSFHRKRVLYMLFLAVVMAAAIISIDPDDDFVGSKMLVLKYGKVALNVIIAFMLDKLIFGYGPSSDREKLFQMVRLSDTDGGLPAAIAAFARTFAFIGILWAVTAGYALAQDVRTYVPEPCRVNTVSYLKQEQQRWWPDHPEPQALPALAEQESCITLKHPRCCSTKSRLRTERVVGANILQITRVWRPDGTLRFDALAELRAQHPNELGEWSWSNVYDRADLANRGMVLKMRDNFRFFARLIHDPSRALDFADGGYNAGNGAMQTQRTACQMRRSCDPQQWFGHAELTCNATGTIPGTRRTGCDIRRDHVHMVRQVRADKYRRLML